MYYRNKLKNSYVDGFSHNCTWCSILQVFFLQTNYYLLFITSICKNITGLSDGNFVVFFWKIVTFIKMTNQLVPITQSKVGSNNKKKLNKTLDTLNQYYDSTWLVQLVLSTYIVHSRAFHSFDNVFILTRPWSGNKINFFLLYLHPNIVL